MIYPTLFTNAFPGITELPICNEFDGFAIYKNEPISFDSLYIIQAGKNEDDRITVRV